jgi:hypothetical protein
VAEWLLLSFSEEYVFISLPFRNISSAWWYRVPQPGMNPLRAADLAAA